MMTMVNTKMLILTAHVTYLKLCYS